LGVLSVLCSYGYELNQGLDVLSKLHSVVGRMQRLGGDDQPLIVIDYAHSPDALKNVLTTLRAHCAGKLWCVFGCGGDRDAGKRPLMGGVSESYADVIIITDDNPRFETSEKIIKEIVAGINHKTAIIKSNRAEAIAYAVSQADVNDVVLVAGKGHEQYQESQGVKVPFSDVAHAQAALQIRGVAK
jgi:UDP-N-acetylmuramoyl-L-alanyl-D-glutamate--2,6-diaminopimelate ligase